MADMNKPWLQERKDHPLGGGKHTFKISVVIRGSGADYEGVLTTVEEKAFNLRDALQQAAARPMRDYFEDDITEERNKDHEEALESEVEPL